MATRDKVRSCKTNRLIAVGGNVYNALERTGYSISDKQDKQGNPFFDHPTENNKCHPRRSGKSPRAKGKRSPKGQGRPKRVLQEGEPKRPGSSFTLFQSAYLNKLKSQYSPDQLKGQASALVRQAWSSLSATEKARWKSQYETLAQQYKQELEAFEARGGVRTPRTSTAKATPKRKATPKALQKMAVQQEIGKRPVTGYIKFSQDMRQRVVDELVREGVKPTVPMVSKRTSEYWNSDERLKSAYNAQQSQLMEQYKQLKEQVTGSQPARQKRSLNPYILFSNEMRPTVQAQIGVSPGRKGLGKSTPRPQDVMRRIGEMWQSLSEAEKDVYRQRSGTTAPVKKATPKKRSPKASPKKRTPRKKTPKVSPVKVLPVSPPRSASPVRRVSPAKTRELLGQLQSRSVSPPRVSPPRVSPTIQLAQEFENIPMISGIEEFEDVPLMKPKTGLPSRRARNY